MLNLKKNLNNRFYGRCLSQARDLQYEEEKTGYSVLSNLCLLVYLSRYNKMDQKLCFEK